MITVVVDRKHPVTTIGNQEAAVRAIVTEPSLGIVKHEKICELLRIGRFIPAPQFRPYVLWAVSLSVFETPGNLGLFSMSGWYECYSCHMPVTTRSTTRNPDDNQFCGRCRAKRIPNFNSGWIA